MSFSSQISTDSFLPYLFTIFKSPSTWRSLCTLGSRGVLEFWGKILTQNYNHQHAHVHNFISQSLMATSKPGNRGLHRAGWLCPTRPAADVGGTDFVFFFATPFSKAVCVQLVLCWTVYCSHQAAIYKHLSHSYNIYWSLLQTFSKLKLFGEMWVVHGSDYRWGTGSRVDFIFIWQISHICLRWLYNLYRKTPSALGPLLWMWKTPFNQTGSIKWTAEAGHVLKKNPADVASCGEKSSEHEQVVWHFKHGAGYRYSSHELFFQHIHKWNYFKRCSIWKEIVLLSSSILFLFLILQCYNDKSLVP